MGVDIVMYVQRYNRENKNWEMLPLKVQYKYSLHKDYHYAYFCERNHGLHTFLCDYNKKMEEDETKYIEKEVHDKEYGLTPEEEFEGTAWYTLTLTKLRLIPFIAHITDRDRKEYEEDEWHDDYENPVYQVNRIKDLIKHINTMLMFTGDDFGDTDDIRIAYYMSY